ncbi:MAG: SDR family NAD(P)-dependent oxidoreductase [bacterium]
MIIEDIGKMYKKALVTGGAGFIGSHICEDLLVSGIKVVSLDDYSAGKEKNHSHLEKHPNFSAVKCDITNSQELSKHFQGVDLVFHNAASKKNICLKDPRRDLDVNAGGTYNMLELSKENGVKKFVHASTGSVYGEAQHIPQNEQHPLNPVSYYGVSKLAGEKYAILFNKLFGLNVTVLRYFHVFGSRQESNEFGGVVPIFIRSLLEGHQPIIFGDGKQERSFTYVKDVVKANLLVAVKEKSTGEVYNCASGISVTIQELCEKVIEEFGKKGIVEPKYEDWLIGDIKKFNIDNAKIKSLGMEFETDFHKALKTTIEETKKYLNS